MNEKSLSLQGLSLKPSIRIQFKPRLTPRVPALNPASWRNFARQPGGIMTMLLLVLLLAFRAHACPMLFDADPAPSSTHHGCHHDTVTPPDIPTVPAPLPCHDGVCLQAFGDQGEFDLHHLLANGLDWPAPNITSGWLPPDWSSRRYLPPPFVTAVGPPPLQRSRVLRL